jgi:hypothetical protein
MLKKLVCVFGFFGLTHCASLNSVSLTQIPQNRSQPVQAEASKWVFLALNFNNDYVNEVTEDLRAKCPQGKVTGILTKYTTTSYLLICKHEVTAKGYCVKESQL